MAKPEYVVAIVWRDAAYDKGPITKDELEGLANHVTVGLFVSEDDEVVSVAADWCLDGDNPSFRSVYHIPKRDIVYRIDSFVDITNTGAILLRDGVGEHGHSKMPEGVL